MSAKLLGHKALLFGHNYLKDGTVGYSFGPRDAVKRGIREQGSVGTLLERDTLIGYWSANELASFGSILNSSMVREMQLLFLF